MYTKSKPNPEKMEAFLDGELTLSEQREVQTFLEENPEELAHFEALKADQSLIQDALRARADEAMASIDWDQFSNRVMEQVALEEAPCPVQPSLHHVEDEAGTSGWMSRLRNMMQWVRLHPGLSLSCVAMAGVLMIVSFTFMDPGPNPDNTVLVEKISNIKTAQVAVMQSKNKATGKNMTIIVVNEPIFDDNSASPTNKRRPHSNKDGNATP